MLDLVLLVLSSGGLFLVVLPAWWWHSVHRGLRTRTRRPFSVRLDGDQLEIVDDGARHAIPLSHISRVRHARNANWTGSKLVEDAMTLFDVDGRRLAKVPVSASGFQDLRIWLETSSVPVQIVDVEAPAYLD